MIATPTGTDLNGGDLLPGDVVEYRIDVRNDGTDTADRRRARRRDPAGTTYVAGLAERGRRRGHRRADVDAGELNGSTANFDLGSLAPVPAR